MRQFVAKPECTKCLSEDIDVAFESNFKMTTDNGKWLADTKDRKPALVHVCNRCGFTWPTETADQSHQSSPIPTTTTGDTNE